jgi:ketosteroid isomerase-like protein
MTDISQSAALETALAYHRAWTSGDLEGAIAHVADDIVCRAPGGDITGKDAYRGFLGGFAANVTGLTDVAAFGDEEHVVLFYYPHTAATSTAAAAEHFTIRDGQIVESQLVFDRLSFTPLQQQ